MIVLDTHAWLWWVTEPKRLSDTARKAIEQAPSIGVSTLSAWEIATLVARGRISLDREVSLWVRQALADARVESLAPSPEVAVAAGLLDARSFPGDPVDRLIYATARAAGATLITRDQAIRAFDSASTLW
ncbi:MAG TPA: type II toxin-antitoxin system VapC family toxin [Solirubrobacteraceae bacterium]|nr:type II toxin-antitoxin system VapC family toxin [Solirubrobacteraceae bacterium]